MVVNAYDTMLGLCKRCKQCVCITVDGKIYCKKLGWIPMGMWRCRYFETDEEEFTKGKNVIYGSPQTTDGEVVR